MVLTVARQPAQSLPLPRPVDAVPLHASVEADTRRPFWSRSIGVVMVPSTRSALVEATSSPFSLRHGPSDDSREAIGTGIVDNQAIQRPPRPALVARVWQVASPTRRPIGPEP